MQSIGVLFVRDPVIALDLAEILALQLGSTQLMTPQNATQASFMLNSAAFVITDQKGLLDLERLRPNWSAPTLFLGSDFPAQSKEKVTRIAYPFTNNSITEALTALDLVSPRQSLSGAKHR